MCSSCFLLSQVAAFERTKQMFGGLDIVLNNAGICIELKWKKMIDINLVYMNVVLYGGSRNSCICR